MICPQCKKEYPRDQYICPDCHLPLIDPEKIDYYSNRLNLVTVFKTDDPGLIPIIKSLLSDAEIPFIIKSDGLQTIYAFGKTAFRVLEDDAEAAIELLDELKDKNME